MKPTLLSALLISLLCIPTFAADPGTPGGLPPGEKEAKAVLDKSPRHGEFVDITVTAAKTPLKSYIVYPERKDKAPVVIVIHEIFGLSDWVRSVADQLAADGFIAIAPDMLSGHGPNGGGTDSLGGRQEVTRAVSGLPRDEVTRDLEAVREYGMKLPAASGKTATIGFCWGGGQSFRYATNNPNLRAVVVCYGPAPDSSAIRRIQAPVLGIYGEEDARITGSLPDVVAQMQSAGKTFSHEVFPGTGHGFLKPGRQGSDGPQVERAWTRILEFYRARLGQ